MFHTTEGLFFERTPTGGVRIIKTTDGRMPSPDNILFEQEVGDGPWCSAVCSVSKGDETGERWRQAMSFHND